MDVKGGQRHAQDLLQVNNLFVCLFVNPNPRANMPFDRSSIQAEDLTNVRCIREVNRVWGLNPDTTIT